MAQTMVGDKRQSVSTLSFTFATGTKVNCFTTNGHNHEEQRDHLIVLDRKGRRHPGACCKITTRRQEQNPRTYNPHARSSCSSLQNNRINQALAQLLLPRPRSTAKPIAVARDNPRQNSTPSQILSPLFLMLQKLKTFETTFRHEQRLAFHFRADLQKDDLQQQLSRNQFSRQIQGSLKTHPEDTAVTLIHGD